MSNLKEEGNLIISEPLVTNLTKCVFLYQFVIDTKQIMTRFLKSLKNESL